MGDKNYMRFASIWRKYGAVSNDFEFTMFKMILAINAQMKLLFTQANVKLIHQRNCLLSYLVDDMLESVSKLEKTRSL